MIFVDYPGHFVAALLLAAFAVLVLFTFRLGESRNPKLRSHRVPLILLQLASILTLLLILWNPSRAKVSRTPSENSVLAIFDTSESMSVVEEAQSTRLDKALDVFQRRLCAPNNSAGYRILGFDEQSYYAGSVDFLRRWGPQTDMHGVFASLARHAAAQDGPESSYDRSRQSGKTARVENGAFTGAVIFTDGQAADKNIETYLLPPDKNLRTVFVGVGSRVRQADLAITSIDAPAQMAVETACNVQVVVAARNLRDKSVKVELLKDNHVIDTRQIPADKFAPNRSGQAVSGRQATVEFAVGADRLGSCALSARVIAAENEVNQANNTRSTIIEVVEQTGLKVLLYSQVANFNIGKVRQALARDEKIQLDLSLDVIRDRTVSEHASNMCGYVKLPGDKRGFNKYDIVILGPCDLEALTGAQVNGLYSFVADRGGGLILLPGKADFGPVVWTNPKAKALIPVIFDADEPTIWPGRPADIELTLEGIDSGVLDPEALKDFDEQALPYYRITDSKPASTTLLSIKGTPVVSVHRVGRGRVCLLNATQLFRWYREDTQGGLLYRIMAGLTAHLGRVTSREAGIELFAGRVAEQPDKVTFEAYVYNESFDPVGGANVLLSLGETVVSMHDAGRGRYVAELENIRNQAIVATAQAESDGVFLGERTIAANLPPARSEMTDIELDEEFLKALAKKVNGRYVHVDDVDHDVVQAVVETAATAGSSRQMTSIWPNWLLLAILCTLLSMNWFFRRSIGLV